jgi:ATP-binding cassette subfamily B protein
MRLLFVLMLRHWRLIGIGILGLLGVDALQLLVPKIMQYVIDGLAQGTATRRSVLAYGLAIGGAAAGMGLCRFMWRYYLLGASHRVVRQVRQDLYDHLLTLSPQYYDRHKVGDITAHCTNDTQAIRHALGFGTLAAIDAAVMAAATLTFMLVMSWELTLITLLPLPPLALMVTYFGRVVHRRFEEVQACFSRVTERAQESFSGIRVVKSYADEESEKKYFNARAGQYRDDVIGLAKMWALFDPMIGALALTSVVLLLYFGGRKVIVGQLSIGQFVAFSSYLHMFVWPMIAIGVVVNRLQRGAASMERIMRILHTPPDIRDGATQVTLAPALECRNLRFTYPETDATVLSDVSFELQAGHTLGIVGRTGSGKTTLVELFMRLYDAPPGTVFVDGHDVRDLAVDDVRELFGYVPQDSFLFAMSVRNNIRFGAPDTPDTEVEHLARLACIHNEILEFPDGYETLVGERGITLSGGQKQRVSIARALALKPRVLVLDDALSSVDTETEAEMLRNLLQEVEGITAVLIAHRISTVKNADQIIVIEDGVISDRGTHEELLAREGYYSELYALQSLEAAALHEDDRE